MNNLCSFFPFENVRPGQDKLIKLTRESVIHSNSLLVHAPTGIGKTAAVLAPALEHARKKKLKVFFLTSRHTQHKIALDTLKLIKEETGLSLCVSDIIGKQHMCAHDNLDKVSSSDFHEFCRKLVEDGQCPYYAKTKQKQKPTAHAAALIEQLAKTGPHHVERIIADSKAQKLCPYEIAGLLAQKSDVIICDYYYVFSPKIRDYFMQKNRFELEKSVIIVDEGHNLPSRVRDLLSVRLSSYILSRSLKEAKAIRDERTLEILKALDNFVMGHAQSMKLGEEKPATMHALVKALGKDVDIEEVIANLEFSADEVREKKRVSFIGSVANFLDKWRGKDEGYVRLISLDKTQYGSNVSVTYRCLDPALVSKEVVDNAHSVIVMSGTLRPLEMYRDLLGFEEHTPCVALTDPFPKENRLNMIIPETTTKYTQRNPDQWKRIARVCTSIAKLVPGNTALFFPSYYILDQVRAELDKLTDQQVFFEDKALTKDQKSKLLATFISRQNHGSILMGVASANFAEGIDIPGNILKSVVVVGLPLQKPNIEAKALIEYYDLRFKKGWDYGYLFPAFNKVLQMAGRCIRSETDKGIIAFLDERYMWPMYKRLFPHEKGVFIAQDYKEIIHKFFSG